MSIFCCETYPDPLVMLWFGKIQLMVGTFSFNKMSSEFNIFIFIFIFIFNIYNHKIINGGLPIDITMCEDI